MYCSKLPWWTEMGQLRLRVSVSPEEPAMCGKLRVGQQRMLLHMSGAEVPDRVQLEYRQLPVRVPSGPNCVSAGPSMGCKCMPMRGQLLANDHLRGVILGPNNVLVHQHVPFCPGVPHWVPVGRGHVPVQPAHADILHVGGEVVRRDVVPIWLCGGPYHMLLSRRMRSGDLSWRNGVGCCSMCVSARRSASRRTVASASPPDITRSTPRSLHHCVRLHAWPRCIVHHLLHGKLKLAASSRVRSL